MSSPPTAPFTFDIPTVLSIGLVFAFLPLAQSAAHYLLPKFPRTSTKQYYLFLWCAFDVLTHTIVEGSFLYHCFFSYLQLDTAVPGSAHPASLGGAGGLRSTGIENGPFLGHADRLYGAWYSTAPMARLWQEYAKADRRWGGADVTIIALEILTVFGAGPLACYMCVLITKITNSTDVRYQGGLRAKLWFTAIVLSTAELYGGFITFAPEWLSGSVGLDTADPVFLWLYLIFFNVLWVFIPAWILWEAVGEMKSAFVHGASVEEGMRPIRANEAISGGVKINQKGTKVA